MNKAMFLIASTLLQSAWGLSVVKDTGSGIDAAPYLMALNVSQNKEYVKKEPPSNFQTPGLPAKSHLMPGDLMSFKIDEGTNIPKISFFVTGVDAASLAWLEKNEDLLKEKGALGFVTNVDSIAQISMLSRQYDLPFLPINADVLASVLQVKHYPFFSDGREVWQ